MQDFDASTYGEHIAEVYDKWYVNLDTDAAVDCVSDASFSSRK